MDGHVQTKQEISAMLKFAHNVSHCRLVDISRSLSISIQDNMIYVLASWQIIEVFLLVGHLIPRSDADYALRYISAYFQDIEDSLQPFFLLVLTPVLFFFSFEVLLLLGQTVLPVQSLKNDDFLLACQEKRQEGEKEIFVREDQISFVFAAGFQVLCRNYHVDEILHHLGEDQVEYAVTVPSFLVMFSRKRGSYRAQKTSSRGCPSSRIKLLMVLMWVRGYGRFRNCESNLCLS